MPKCRPRSLNADQCHVLTYALLGDKDEPVAKLLHPRDAQLRPDRTDGQDGPAQAQVGGFRIPLAYNVTERGAAAVGLWLPED